MFALFFKNFLRIKIFSVISNFCYFSNLPQFQDFPDFSLFFKNFRLKLLTNIVSLI